MPYSLTHTSHARASVHLSRLQIPAVWVTQPSRHGYRSQRSLGCNVTGMQKQALHPSILQHPTPCDLGLVMQLHVLVWQASYIYLHTAKREHFLPAVEKQFLVSDSRISLAD